MLSSGLRRKASIWNQLLHMVVHVMVTTLLLMVKPCLDTQLNMCSENSKVAGCLFCWQELLQMPIWITDRLGM